MYLKTITLFFLFPLTIFSCKSPASRFEALPGLNLRIQSITTYPVNSSIRALEVVDEQTVWFAGSGGVYGYTENGGKTWQIDSIRTDTFVPHFRAIAVTKKAVYLLNIGSPALLYRSTNQGRNWKIVYREDHPGAFYDAMVFQDEDYGVAMGDPTDGCLSVIRTLDGGESWEKISCDKLPPTVAGEAAFAASNSNLALSGKDIWLVSGGAKARVFHSPDRGDTWQVFNTPIIGGGQMTGIFSVDFYDKKQGIIFGGDWNEQEHNQRNKAVTNDGGLTWQLIANGTGPGYRSSVRYLPGGRGKAVLAVGIPGISYSADGGRSWRDLNKESWYTVRFGKNWRNAWLAGDRKIGKIAWEE